MLPLDVGSLDILYGIETWIRDWWGCQTLIKLDHMGWFTQGKISENCLWSPPLTAIDTAMEMILGARYERPYVSYIIVCPHLITHLCRNFLIKDAGIMFNIPIW